MGGRALSTHLLSAKSNDRVHVIEPRGLLAQELHGQLEELTAGAITTRTSRPVYHVHLDPLPEAWSENVRMAFWSRFEAEFGLTEARYCGVLHQKGERFHEHRAYDLTRDDGSVVSLSFDRLRRAKIAVLVAHEFGLPPPPIKHVRAVIRQLEIEGHGEAAEGLEAQSEEPVRIALRAPLERALEERKGASKADAAKSALEAWKASDGGVAFEAALAMQGLVLAQGDTAPVVLDAAGAAWPIARLLGQASRAAGEERIRSQEVSRRLSILVLPLAAEVRHEQADRSANLNSGQSDGGSEAPASGSRAEDCSGDPQDATSSGDDDREHADDPGPSLSQRGGGGSDPRCAGSDHPGAAAPASDPGGDSEKARRARRAAKIKVAIAIAARQARAAQIAATARRDAHAAQARAVERLSSDLQRRDEAIRKQLATLDKEPSPPSELLAARERLAALTREVRDCAIKCFAANRLLNELIETRPTGLWAHLSRKVRDHDARIATAQDEADRLNAARHRAVETKANFAFVTQPKEVRWRKVVSADEAERAARRKNLEIERAWLADAQRCLGRRPELAQEPRERFSEAVDRMRAHQHALASLEASVRPGYRMR